MKETSYRNFREAHIDAGFPDKVWEFFPKYCSVATSLFMHIYLECVPSNLVLFIRRA